MTGMTGLDSPAGSLRRAVVALDASAHSQAVLRATARMAAMLDLELVGVFVEDETLLRLADLPVTWEVGAKTATVRQMDSRDVARQFRALSTQMQRSLASAARQAGVPWRLHVARGDIVPELLAVIEPTDLLGMGRMGWPLSRRPRLGSTTQAMLQRSPCPVFIPDKAPFDPPRPRSHIVAVWDGSDAGERGITLAVSLAGAVEAGLTLLLFAADGSAAQPHEEACGPLQERAEAILDDLDTARIPGIDFQMGLRTPAHLVGVLNSRGDDLIFLPQPWSSLADELAGAVVVVV